MTLERPGIPVGPGRPRVLPHELEEVSSAKEVWCVFAETAAAGNKEPIAKPIRSTKIILLQKKHYY